jgi:hypothetical protein
MKDNDKNVHSAIGNDSTFFKCAPFANPCTMQKKSWSWSYVRQAHIEIRNSQLLYSTRWRGIFKGLSQDGERADISKNLRAFLFINTYQMNLISSGNISLDSTSKTLKTLFFR